MGKRSRTPDARILLVVKVVDRLNAAGDAWWSGEEIARVAIPRWDSYGRRHSRTKAATRGGRILDLMKGMQAHFEPDVPYTHSGDWRALSEALAEVLELPPA
jgi:hypothetical protein